MKDYNQILEQLEAAGCLRHLPEITHCGNWIEQDGETLLNLSSNDYLGLASRHDMRNEFMKWAEKTALPFSSSSSRLLTGNYTVYTELEETLAEMFDREAALLFNSGYHCNSGILPALCDKQTLIVADKLVHASLIDGIRLSGTPFKRYRHNDYDQLEQLLDANAYNYEQTVIVTESLFSMDGDVADLRRLVALKHRYPNILLYVDEAHAIGVRGKQGLGVAEEQDCIGEIDLLVGTLGKAIASMGAYVVCSRLLRDYLVNTMRPLIFSTALPPIQIAWTWYIFDRLPSMQEERKRLRHNSHILREGLRGRGGEISDSHIVPWIVGDNAECVRMAEQLQRKGFYCLAVRPPTVPEGTARIRFSVTAEMEEDQIQLLLKAIDELCESRN